eukprot:scaffold7390_cov248-Pinguiococcus_pyrenoidosus.AAC.1
MAAGLADPGEGSPQALELVHRRCRRFQFFPLLVVKVTLDAAEVDKYSFLFLLRDAELVPHVLLGVPPRNVFQELPDKLQSALRVTTPTSICNKRVPCVTLAQWAVPEKDQEPVDVFEALCPDGRAGDAPTPFGLDLSQDFGFRRGRRLHELGLVDHDAPEPQASDCRRQDAILLRSLAAPHVVRVARKEMIILGVQNLKGAQNDRLLRESPRIEHRQRVVGDLAGLQLFPRFGDTRIHEQLQRSRFDVPVELRFPLVQNTRWADNERRFRLNAMMGGAPTRTEDTFPQEEASASASASTSTSTSSFYPPESESLAIVQVTPSAELVHELTALGAFEIARVFHGALPSLRTAFDILAEAHGIGIQRLLVERHFVGGLDARGLSITRLRLHKAETLWGAFGSRVVRRLSIVPQKQSNHLDRLAQPHLVGKDASRVHPCVRNVLGRGIAL